MNHAIVAGVVRRNGHIDFKRAAEVPLEGLDDLAVLALAAQEGRVLVSHDVATIPVHLREFVRASASPGVIMIPRQMSIGMAIESLLPSMAMYGF